MCLISILHLAYGEMGAPVLKSLINDQRYDVVGIVTPPIDADLYRQASFLPQEQVAHDHKIIIFKTDKLSKIHELVANLSPDLVLIASFSKLIPEPTLNLSKFINIHHGKLPRQRGRANINWAIINGEPSVSVSIHEAVAELDAGNILRQYHFTITSESDVADMYRQINETLFAELPDLLAEYLDGRVSLQVQDQSRATFYCTRLPEDGMIDWTWPAAKVINLIRALRNLSWGLYLFR